MIATEHLQIWLPFQNSITDYGKAGITWDNAGTQKYSKGQFGNQYEFESPTNYLIAGPSTNPCNIINEFTYCFWVFRDNTGEFRVADLGEQSGSVASAVKMTSIRILSNGKLRCTIQDNTTLGYNGAVRGRYESTLTVGTGNVFVFFSRTNSKVEIITYDDSNGRQVEEFSYSGGNYSLFDSRRLWVGAFKNSQNDSPPPSLEMTDGKINTFMFYNKALHMTDGDRLFHNLHPLNG